MLTFNLKKEWFDKIKTGEKTHEYRKTTNYWETRLAYYYDRTRFNEPFEEKRTICFACGYPKKDDDEKRLYAKVISVTKTYGSYTDLKEDNTVFDIEFKLIKE